MALVNFSPMAQIWRLASRRNAKTKVRVLPLKAQAGGHRAHGLEHQVADEQGPAHGDDNILYLPYHRGVGFKIGQIEGEDIQQGVRHVFHSL